MSAGILVTVRLKSSRLPRKALLPLSSSTLLDCLVDRLTLVRSHPPIVLCTSDLPEDDPIEELADRRGVDCFRGDPVDVLSRLNAASEAFGLERLWNVTGDNPFTDPIGLEALMETHLCEGNDFTRTTGLPLGAFGYALEARALKIACARKEATDTEIWGPLFTETGLFRCGVYRETDPRRTLPGLRLTIDTAEDYAFARELLRRFPRWPSLAEIVALCRADPSLSGINSGIAQREAPPEVARLRGA